MEHKKSSATYFEHLRTTRLASGESSAIQFLPADGDLSISSSSSLKELLLPSSHLNDPSLTKPSSILLVLLTVGVAISNFHPAIWSKWKLSQCPVAHQNQFIQFSTYIYWRQKASAKVRHTYSTLSKSSFQSTNSPAAQF